MKIALCAQYAGTLLLAFTLGFTPVYSAVLFTEDFESYTAGDRPVPTNGKISPSENTLTAGSELYVQVVEGAENHAGSGAGKGLELFDNTSESNYYLAYLVENEESQVGSLHISMNLAMETVAETTPNSNNRFYVAIGGYNSSNLSAGSRRDIEINIRADDLSFRIVSSTKATLVSTQSYALDVYINDSETETISYTAPAGGSVDLAPNTYDVYLDNALEGSGSLEDGAIGDDASIGAFGIGGSSTGTGTRMTFDNIEIATIEAESDDSVEESGDDSLLFSEDFESSTVGQKPNTANSVTSPSTPETDYFIKVVGEAENFAGSGNGLEILDTATSSTRFAVPLIPGTTGNDSEYYNALEVELDFAWKDLEDSGSQRVILSLGESEPSTTFNAGSGGDRHLDIQFRENGSVRLGSSSTIVNVIDQQSYKMNLFLNDDDTDSIVYTAPGGTAVTLAANSVDVYINGVLAKQGGLVGDSLTSENNFGSFGLATGSSDSGMNYVFDNIIIKTVSAPVGPTPVFAADFEANATDTSPVFTSVRPSTAVTGSTDNTDVYAHVVEGAGNVAGGGIGKGLRLFADSAVSAQVGIEQNIATDADSQLADVHISFDAAWNDIDSSSSNFRFAVGGFDASTSLRHSAGSRRDFDFKLSDGAIGAKSISEDTIYAVDVYINDSDNETLRYTDPAGNVRELGSNTYVYYVDGEVIAQGIYTEGSAGTAYTGENIGRFGFTSNSAQSGIDWTIDNISVYRVQTTTDALTSFALFEDDFESSSVGSAPSASYIRPSSSSADYKIEVVSGPDNVAGGGGGQGIQLVDNSVVSSGGGVLYKQDLSSVVGSLHASFDFAWNDLANPSVDPDHAFRISLAQAGATMWGNGNRYMDINFSADGRVNLDGFTGNEIVSFALTDGQAYRFDLFANDSDTDKITFTGPDGLSRSIPPNSFAFYVDNTFVGAEQFDQEVSGDATIGRFGITSASSFQSLDYTFDNFSFNAIADVSASNAVNTLSGDGVLSLSATDVSANIYDFDNTSSTNADLTVTFPSGAGSGSFTATERTDLSIFPSEDLTFWQIDSDLDLDSNVAIDIQLAAGLDSSYLELYTSSDNGVTFTLVPDDNDPSSMIYDAASGSAVIRTTAFNLIFAISDNPAPETIAIILSAPDQVDVTFESRPGRVYAVQSGTDLAALSSVQTITAVGNSETYTRTGVALGDKEFFRVSYEGVPREIFSLQTFESGDGGFTTLDNSTDGVGSEWSLGTPNVTGLGGTISSASSGSSCWGVELTGEYNSDTNTSLRSSVIDLSGLDAVRLSYSQALDIDGTDTAVVRLIENDSNTVITELLSVVDSDEFSSTWENVTLPVDLTAVSGLPSDGLVRVEWSLFASDASFGGYMGWYIDDVELSENVDSSSDGEDSSGGEDPSSDSVIFSEDFESSTAGSTPSTANSGVSSGVMDGLARTVLVVGDGDNLAGSGNGLEILDESSASGSSTRYTVQLTPGLTGNDANYYNALEIQLDFVWKDLTQSGSDRVTLSLGESETGGSEDNPNETNFNAGSSGDRHIEVQFRAKGEIKLVSEGAVYSTVFSTSEMVANTAYRMNIFANDDDAALVNYTAPDGSTVPLAANTMDVYIDGNLEKSAPLFRTATNNNFGSFGLATGSGDDKVNFIFDNIIISTIGD